MTDAGAATPPGWYPDPAQPGAQRWWDGTAWGEQHVPLKMCTTSDLAGHRVDQVLGICVGLVANSMGFGKSFSASVQSMAQGEVPQCTEALERGRQVAIHRLEEHAKSLGANAVLALRLEASELTPGLVEFVAYGTAAVVSPLT